MTGNLTIQMILMIVIGVAVFVAGITLLRFCFRMRKPEATLKATVLQQKLIQKKDKEGHLIQNYYELVVRMGQNIPNRTIKSTVQYEKGDEVTLFLNGREYSLQEKSQSMLSAVFIILLGLGIIFFPIAYERYGEKAGSAVLVLILLMVGACLFSIFIKDKNRRLCEMQGEIADILYYKTGEGKKFSKPVVSYYPIIRYHASGEERLFQSKYNSSTRSTYKAGSPVRFYWDKDNKCIVEKKPSIALVVLAAIFWTLATAGIISIFMM